MTDEDFVKFKASVLEGDRDVLQVLEAFEAERVRALEIVHVSGVPILTTDFDFVMVARKEVERLATIELERDEAKREAVSALAREKEALRRLSLSFRRSEGPERMHTRSKYRWNIDYPANFYTLEGGGIKATVGPGARSARLPDCFIAFVSVQGFRAHESEHGSASDAIAAAEEALERAVALRRLHVDEPFKLPEIEVRF